MKALLSALMLSVALAGPALACKQPAGAAKIEAGLVDWINTQRTGKGLGRLRVSAVLGTAAAAHACDMAGRGFFAHNGPGGPSFQARLKRAGYRFSAAVENIAKSRSASAGTAEGIWRKSSAHWGNILNGSIHDIGVAVATDGADVFYVFVGGSQ